MRLFLSVISFTHIVCALPTLAHGCAALPLLDPVVDLRNFFPLYLQNHHAIETHAITFFLMRADNALRTSCGIAVFFANGSTSSSSCSMSGAAGASVKCVRQYHGPRPVTDLVRSPVFEHSTPSFRPKHTRGGSLSFFFGVSRHPHLQDVNGFPSAS